MTSYYDRRIDNLFNQIAIDHPEFALFLRTTSWLRDFAQEVQRKYRWGLVSSYSDHAHPALESALATSISMELVGYTIVALIEALRPTSGDSDPST